MVCFFLFAQRGRKKTPVTVISKCQNRHHCSNLTLLSRSVCFVEIDRIKIKIPDIVSEQ